MRASYVVHILNVSLNFLETKEWMQPKVQGDMPESRGQHCVAVVGEQLVLYGGSSHFSPETMMCSKLYGDTFVLQKGKWQFFFQNFNS